MVSSNHQKYKSKNPLQRVLLGNFLRQIRGIVWELKPKKLLDAGCAEGMVLNYLEKKGVKPKFRVGVDLSQTALKIAKKNNPGCRFRRADVGKLPFKADSFDLVICLEVLEHTKSYRKVLKELVRVSKKYVLVSVPLEPWFSWGNAMRGKNVRFLGRDPQHINFWSKGDFGEVLAKLDVQIVKHKIVFPWQAVLFKAGTR